MVWLLFSSCGVLVTCSLVVMCRLLSSLWWGALQLQYQGSPLSLQCAGPPYCGWGTHLYFLQSDSSLGMVSGVMVSPCGWWLLLNSSGILLFSCSCGPEAPLELQWSLFLGGDGWLWRGFLSSFGTWCSSQSFAWMLLSACEGLLSSYFMGLASMCSRGAPLYMWCLAGQLSTYGKENLSSFGGGSSVTGASDSSHVAAKDSVVPL